PFSSGIGLSLLITLRFVWKSSFEKCFSLAIESSIFAVKVKYKCRRRATAEQAHAYRPVGSRTPPSLRQRYCLPPLCVFSLRFYVRSARLNRFYACAR